MTLRPRSDGSIDWENLRKRLEAATASSEAALEISEDRARQIMEERARARGIAAHLPLSGKPCNLLFGTLDRDLEPSQSYRTLFLQEIIRRGVHGPSFVISYAHKEGDVDETIEAVDGALEIYARALEDGVERHLVGRPSEPVYRTYNSRPPSAPLKAKAAG